MEKAVISPDTHVEYMGPPPVISNVNKLAMPKRPDHPRHPRHGNNRLNYFMNCSNHITACNSLTLPLPLPGRGWGGCAFFKHHGCCREYYKWRLGALFQHTK